MSTVFYMMDRYFGNDSLEPFESIFIDSTGTVYLWLSWPSLMRGYQNIFQYMGIFMRFFADGNLCVGLLVAGGFIWFPLHMTMVWYLARGAGIPSPSDAVDVCVSKHQSALIRGDGDSQLHRRAAGPRT